MNRSWYLEETKRRIFKQYRKNYWGKMEKYGEQLKQFDFWKL